MKLRKTVLHNHIINQYKNAMCKEHSENYTDFFRKIPKEISSRIFCHLDDKTGIPFYQRRWFIQEDKNIESTNFLQRQQSCDKFM